MLVRATPTVEVFLVPVGPVFGPHFGFDSGYVGFRSGPMSDAAFMGVHLGYLVDNHFSTSFLFLIGRR